MLAQPSDLPRDWRMLREGGWVFQRKLDGLRCVASKRGALVELWSRNRLSFLGRFPTIAAELAAVPVDDFVLDGELVSFVGDRSSFSDLQSNRPSGRTVYCAFDVTRLLGRDTTELALRDRTDLLARVVQVSGPLVSMPETLEGDPEDLLRQACAAGWEGLIAKRASSPYRPGRSGDWRKLKCTARQEFVIGGWTEPTGRRHGFGALLLGYYRGDELLYAGKVGTGFDDGTLRRLGDRLEVLATDVSPFASPVAVKGPHWARPVLVAEVAFSEWTPDRRLRHPSFVGLRPDKAASEVRLEPS